MWVDGVCTTCYGSFEAKHVPYSTVKEGKWVGGGRVQERRWHSGAYLRGDHRNVSCVGPHAAVGGSCDTVRTTSPG